MTGKQERQQPAPPLKAREPYSARLVDWMTAAERNEYVVSPSAAELERRVYLGARRPALGGVRLG